MQCHTTVTNQVEGDRVAMLVAECEKDPERLKEWVGEENIARWRSLGHREKTLFLRRVIISLNSKTQTTSSPQALLPRTKR